METDSTNPAVKSEGQTPDVNNLVNQFYMNKGEADPQSRKQNPESSTQFTFGLFKNTGEAVANQSPDVKTLSESNPQFSFGLLKNRNEADPQSGNQNPDVKAVSESNLQFTFGLPKNRSETGPHSGNQNPAVKAISESNSQFTFGLPKNSGDADPQKYNGNPDIKATSDSNPQFTFGLFKAPSNTEFRSANPVVKPTVQTPSFNNFFNQFHLMNRGEAGTQSQNQNPDVRAISDSNLQFTFDLFKVLGEEPGNLFFSPLSIQVILSLLYLGAKDTTADELRKGLRLPNDDRVIKDGVNATMEQLKAATDVLLDVANKIYLMIGSQILDNFNEAAVKFMASAEQVNFGDGENARQIINEWVEEKTHQRIKDLIPPGTLNSLTTLVLVNAVYFKGDWIKKFDKKSTTKMPFYSTSTENVDMMYVESTFRHAYRHDLSSQVLLLPYKGNSLNMMIFLPNQVNGLPELETKLSNVNFPELMTRMYENNVHVYLPKFKMEYSKNLNETLRKLGITSMFGDRTVDLTGITGDPMKVSHVIHKSFVEVNEEGTEAAAATAVICCVTSVSSQPPPIIFKADHPFIFFIVDKQTCTVLFAGRFASAS